MDKSNHRPQDEPRPYHNPFSMARLDGEIEQWEKEKTAERSKGGSPENTQGEPKPAFDPMFTARFRAALEECESRREGIEIFVPGLGSGTYGPKEKPLQQIEAEARVKGKK
ncbi:MAG: hypothetical protein KKG00_00225 [Bacteroidetes bacterium]|nr:hypothetical protein [Bacteroidota bacterium]